MTRYSIWNLLRQGLRGQTGWAPAWRAATPQPRYDAVIVGGGGHGLATAYYLAQNHGLRRVAVLERGWIGGGNTGRNTTVIRSNYFNPVSAALYDQSVRMYEGLSRALNYNLMFSQRGMIELIHDAAGMDSHARLANAMRGNGVDAELWDAARVRARVPLLDWGPRARWPVLGALVQPRAGVARHDAVAWAYARAADALGVDIIQGCEVTDFLVEGGAVRGVATTLGEIRADAVGLAVAGNSTPMAALAGLRLPIQSYTLQAMVSEPLKPCLNAVVASFSADVYVSQSDKGELVIGGGLDRCPSYAQRGNFATTQRVIAALISLFPSFATLKLLRQWGGVVDVTPDSSPILGPSGVPGLYLNCGWGTGGFKAIPVGGLVLAHAMATGGHHPLSAPFGLARFTTGSLVDEAAGAGIEH